MPALCSGVADQGHGGMETAAWQGTRERRRAARVQGYDRVMAAHGQWHTHNRRELYGAPLSAMLCGRAQYVPLAHESSAVWKPARPARYTSRVLPCQCRSVPVACKEDMRSSVACKHGARSYFLIGTPPLTTAVDAFLTLEVCAGGNRQGAHRVGATQHTGPCPRAAA